MHRLATETTLHTFVPYKYLGSSYPVTRTFLVCLGVMSVLSVPFYLMQEAKAFFSHSAVLLANEWKEEGSIPYPNLTVCNPLFFNRQRMEGEYSGMLFFLKKKTY